MCCVNQRLATPVCVEVELHRVQKLHRYKNLSGLDIHLKRNCLPEMGDETQITAADVEIERLHQELENARRCIREKEEKLQLAASYGVKLLNENKTLTEQHEVMLLSKEKEIDRLEDEVHHLKVNARQHAAEQDYVTELETENDRLRREVEDMARKFDSIRRKNKEMTSEIERMSSSDSQKNRQLCTLQEKIKQLQGRINELQNQVESSIRQEYIDEDLINARTDVARLQDILSKCELEKYETDNLISNLQQRCILMKDSMKELNEENEEKTEQLVASRKELQQVKEDLRIVQAKFDTQQMSNGKMGAGLDLFSEVEDKRQALEESVSHLKRQLRKLRTKYETTNQHCQRLRSHNNMLLQLQSSKADESKLARLEEALSQAQAENYKKERQLTSLRTQLSETKQLLRDHQAAFGEVNYNSYIQTLQEEIDSDKNLIQQLTAERQKMAFAFTNESRKLNEIVGKLHETERKQELMLGELSEKNAKVEQLLMQIDILKLELSDYEEEKQLKAKIHSENTTDRHRNNQNQDFLGVSCEIQEHGTKIACSTPPTSSSFNGKTANLPLPDSSPIARSHLEFFPSINSGPLNRSLEVGTNISCIPEQESKENTSANLEKNGKDDNRSTAVALYRATKIRAPSANNSIECSNQ
eukprot:gene1212-4423_t